MNRKIITWATAGAHVVLALLVQVPILPVSTSQPPHAQEVGFILSGTVSDASNLQPLAGAEVQVDSGQMVLTDLSGVYSMTLPSGVYTVTASASGYSSQITPYVEVLSDTVALDFNLQPYPVLEGYVGDFATGDTIMGAIITTDSGGYSITDRSGHYSMILPPGVHTVYAHADGYYPQTIPDVAVLTGTTWFDIFTTRLPVLTGQVIDRVTLAPIVGARVIAGYYDDLTNSAGVYTITIAMEGWYHVSAQADGYITQGSWMYVPPIFMPWRTVNFSLEPLDCPLPGILAVSTLTDDLTVTFSATISSSLPLSYIWSFGDGLTSTVTAPVHNYGDYGNYSITLTVTSACGDVLWSGNVILLAPWRKLYLPLILKE